MPYIDSVYLSDGASAALGAVKITSIPHISIIDDRKEALSETMRRYKSEMSRVLDEVYLIYKRECQRNGTDKDIAVELLWKTSPVKNQPYNADIHIYLIVRAIDAEPEKAKKTTADILNLFKSMLKLQKYESEDMSAEDLLDEVRHVSDRGIRALIKEETIENLQSTLYPYCYAFGRFPEEDTGLENIVNTLIDYPDSAVSFQLIPTYYDRNEAAEIDRTAQMLEMLKRGVSDQSIGSISFTLADKHAEIYSYYSKHKGMPLFLFNILIYGEQIPISNIAPKVYSQFANGKDQSAKLVLIDLYSSEVNKNNNFYPLPWAVNEILINRNRNVSIWNSGRFSRNLYRLPYVITQEEAAEFFRLPIGSNMVSAGFAVNESGKLSKTYAEDIINSGDITAGKLRSSMNRASIGFSLNDLTKHMLVVGTPGSGKTNFSVSLLIRLWKDYKIPFLVIEPAKNEYRAMIQSIPELQVFTPGKNFISPFVMNPFVPPDNVRLETYKSTLKTAFEAAVSMATPLDLIFEETINNCYSDFKWLDSYTIDDRGEIFNISDFIRCFKKTFEDIGYTGDARNIGRAGVVRLKSLANLFDQYSTIPVKDLLGKPTVIELAAIENSDQKALIISLVLLSVLSYVNTNYTGTGDLRNVVLLEEAHVLLDSGSSAGAEGADPKKVAQGLVKRILAEMRSYGVGMIIADQSPRKVTADIVALTDMKMVFRLVEKTDKQMIADSTNMDDAKMQRMSRLKPGEAFLFFQKLEEPEEIIVPDYRAEHNIDITISDDKLHDLSCYWRGKEKMLRPYPQCEAGTYCRHTCDYSRRLLAREVARRIFVKHFKADMKEFDPVFKVFGRITREVMEELNGETFSDELMYCVKVHLWRKIRYDTQIPVREIQIENSLKKQAVRSNE